MFWLRNEKNNFPVGTLIWRPECRLLMFLANSLDPEQDRQNAGSDPDPTDGIPERLNNN